ncbi:hypothetical protein SAICODRAFT_31258 [Saitoella complicata NRRL Y-17804]|nr:uncharacterized protein SAICODRAFT_31258 [Saitoella complicata NRRL Y-17804]ODQ51293.1 hypothetical protein SAICODRAFT_31258 [Saitoella complicata NRRL Y-17804]
MTRESAPENPVRASQQSQNVYGITEDLSVPLLYSHHEDFNAQYVFTREPTHRYAVPPTVIDPLKHWEEMEPETHRLAAGALRNDYGGIRQDHQRLDSEFHEVEGGARKDSLHALEPPTHR